MPAHDYEIADAEDEGDQHHEAEERAFGHDADEDLPRRPLLLLFRHRFRLLVGAAQLPLPAHHRLGKHEAEHGGGDAHGEDVDGADLQLEADDVDRGAAGGGADVHEQVPEVEAGAA